MQVRRKKVPEKKEREARPPAIIRAFTLRELGTRLARQLNRREGNTRIQAIIAKGMSKGKPDITVIREEQDRVCRAELRVQEAEGKAEVVVVGMNENLPLIHFPMNRKGIERRVNSAIQKRKKTVEAIASAANACGFHRMRIIGVQFTPSYKFPKTEGVGILGVDKEAAVRRVRKQLIRSQRQMVESIPARSWEWRVDEHCYIVEL